MKTLLRVIILGVFYAAPLFSQAGVSTLRPGQVRIVTTYVNAGGKVVSDTILINVLPQAVATIDLFNQILPPRWVPTVTVGKTFCAYAQAKDASGNILTGRPVVFTSSDTTVARVASSPSCPDTTVDMSKILSVPLPPGLHLSLR